MAKDKPKPKKRKKSRDGPLSEKQKALAKMLEGIAKGVRRRSR